MTWEPETDEAWRGDLHLEDWPEECAGPEYLMYKQIVERKEVLGE